MALLAFDDLDVRAAALLEGPSSSVYLLVPHLHRQNNIVKTEVQ